MLSERDAYVDRIAATSGQGAALKWFAVGMIVQWAFIACGQLVVFNGARLLGLSPDRADLVAGLFLLLNLLIARAVLFGETVPRIAARKGYTSSTAWTALAYVFGALALSRVAYLSPKR